MKLRGTKVACAASAALALALASACSSNNTSDAMTADLGVRDSGVGGQDANNPDLGTPDTGGTDTGPTDAGSMDAKTMLNLRTFTPPTDPGGGGVLFTASGEASAVAGWTFPPQAADDTFMVDGWEFRLTRFVAVVDHVKLWSSPNIVPTDQSMHGPVVAHVDGPWIIDLHKGGPIQGKGGGGERAVAVAAIKHMDNGSAFDPSTTYGFGFDTVVATSTAIDLNLTNPNNATESAQALDDYRYMVDNKYSVLYVGTATLLGSNCTTSTPAYDFSKLPSPMQFRMGFNTPTSYVNCQNGTDFGAVKGVNGEDHPRGVQFSASNSITAQITVHMDHPYWESFAENSPIHWDQIAAQYVGMTNPIAHTEDMKNVDFTAFTDNMGKILPWRSCVDPSFYKPPSNGQMHFDPLHVPFNPSQTDPSKALRDYYDYIRYTQATQGHLNSQGLCFISRNYPSPPGGS